MKRLRTVASIETRKAPRQNREAYTVEKGQIGDENKCGPDREPDPLQKLTAMVNPKRRKKEGGNKGDRQQKKGQQDYRPGHGVYPSIMPP